MCAFPLVRPMHVAFFSIKICRCAGFRSQPHCAFFNGSLGNLKEAGNKGATLCRGNLISSDALPSSPAAKRAVQVFLARELVWRTDPAVVHFLGSLPSPMRPSTKPWQQCKPTNGLGNVPCLFFSGECTFLNKKQTKPLHSRQPDQDTQKKACQSTAEGRRSWPCGVG